MPLTFTCHVESQDSDFEDSESVACLNARRETHELMRACATAGIDRILADRDPEDRLASFALRDLPNVSVVIAHKVGAAMPALAAQNLARLDQFGNGRLSIAVSQPDEGLKGQGFNHEASFALLDEYLVLMKRLWANDAPFDHEGPFYSLESAYCEAKPFNGRNIPLILGGLSGTAVKIAAKHADVFSLGGSEKAQARQTISRVRAAAQSYGRFDKIRFSIDVRPVLGVTHADAMQKAKQIDKQEGVIIIAGTAEEISTALLDYRALGVSEFVLRGMNDPREIEAFGKTVIASFKRSSDAQNEASKSGSAYFMPFGRFSRRTLQ